MSDYEASKGQEMRHLKEALSQYGREWLQIPGVHGVGIGYKEVQGELTEQVALVVRVDKKNPREVIDRRAIKTAAPVHHGESAAAELRIDTD